jgi:hypothetical protein
VVPLVEALRLRLPGYEMHHHGPAPAPRAPLDPATLREVQGTIGHFLPPLLVDVWCGIGNGGFGPGYGLLGLGPGGYPDDRGQTADEVYLAFRTRSEKPPHFRWPIGIFPICHFGCAIYHCVDLATEEMVIWEPNTWDGRHSFATALFPTGRSLAIWFTTWAQGESPSKWLRADPATGIPLLAPMRPAKSASRPHKRRTNHSQPDLFAPVRELPSDATETRPKERS